MLTVLQHIDSKVPRAGLEPKRYKVLSDFKDLYGEEPRRLIFIGILNDTDQTGQEAVSYIADLIFQHKEVTN